MLEVNNVSFAYDKSEVLKKISFEAQRGEYIALIGESGCGKSTLLEIIYGLIHIDNGTVLWEGNKLLGPSAYLVPGEPFMKYLPQDFDLMPFTTVEENVGKFLPNRFPKEKAARTKELLEVVDMTDFAKVKVKNLSGGQKQRVALARVLAKEPELLLLDEPFSHIDNFRKNNLRRKLFAYLKQKNIGCVVATHDSTDALSFADTILVMREGQLIAKGKPKSLFYNPKTKYIASFFGDVNELKIGLIDQNEKSTDTVILYPQDISIVENSDCSGIVKNCFFKEGFYLTEVLLDRVLIYVSHAYYLKSEQKVCLEVSKELIESRRIVNN